MKMTIKIITLVLLILSHKSYANSNIQIYESSRGSVGIGCIQDSCRLLAIVSSEDNGDATNGSCTILTKIIKKTEYDYEGKIISLQSKDYSYTTEKINNRRIHIQNKTNTIIIDEVDDLGICALNTNLIDEYTKIPFSKDSSSYKILLETLHENSLSLYKKSKIDEAITQLKPYIETKNASLPNDIKSQKWITPIYNDYAFYLIESGTPEPAIKLLEAITQEAPNRKSAWINLGDAYSALGKNNIALEKYKKYISLMNSSKNTKNIPDRVLDIVNKSSPAQNSQTK